VRHRVVGGRKVMLRMRGWIGHGGLASG
jgi:hypothetical protein